MARPSLASGSVLVAAILGVARGLTAHRSEQPVGPPLLTQWGASLDADGIYGKHPRPSMVRPEWESLNGDWNYQIKDASKQVVQAGKITVPFVIESALSGVRKNLPEGGNLFYERTVDVKPVLGKRYLLHFEACDYMCKVLVNGRPVGLHRGGSTPFEFDITDAVFHGANSIRVKVSDKMSLYKLRGKQTVKPEGIFYSGSTGLWQTVWLEVVPALYIESLHIKTYTDQKSVHHYGTIKVFPFLAGTFPLDSWLYTTVVKVFEQGGGQVGQTVCDGVCQKVNVHFKDARWWSPDDPYLYGLVVSLLKEGLVVDEVASYAGIREVGKRRDKYGHYRMTLNGNFIFPFGVLDQGWWPDGHLTPPTENAMKSDIRFLKRAGYNTIRKHMKVEPRRYYAYCDRIGMLVWQDQVASPDCVRSMQPCGPGMTYDWVPEIENASSFEYVWPTTAHAMYMAELGEMMHTLYNFPSIVAWVPFNEAWGQHQSMEVGNWVKAFDTTRLMNIASGGTFFPIGDFADRHSYPAPYFPLQSVEYRDYIKVVGEFGGFGLWTPDHVWQTPQAGWGYTLMNSTEELMKAYAKSIRKVYKLAEQGVAGAIYTQTTDVETELNGLITYDRRVYKIHWKILKQIHEKLNAARFGE